MNSTQSMLLEVVPHRFTYAWYAFNLNIASKPNQALFHQVFVPMASQMLTWLKASLFN